MEPAPLTISVIYHFPCFDGLFSCLPLHLYYHSFPATTVRYYPYRTNKPFTLTIQPADIVYFLDCIGTKEMLETVLETAREIVILDQHYQVKEIVDSWGVANDSPYVAQKINFSYVRTDICAVRIAWAYFSRLNDRPLILLSNKVKSLLRVFDYIEDRDLYRNVLPDTREAIAGLRCL